jgi:hypothetical protein
VVIAFQNICLFHSSLPYGKEDHRVRNATVWLWVLLTPYHHTTNQSSYAGLTFADICVWKQGWSRSFFCRQPKRSFAHRTMIKQEKAKLASCPHNLPKLSDPARRLTTKEGPYVLNFLIKAPYVTVSRYATSMILYTTPIKAYPKGELT